MKCTTTILLVLFIAAGTLAAPGADAGFFEKKKPERTEKPDWMTRPQRYENLPAMHFSSGILQQEGHTGWKLGDISIQLAKDCIINGDDSASLSAGSEAVVMGPRVGDTIVAWSIRMLKPSFDVGLTESYGVQLRPSTSNSNLGEMINAPQ